MNDKVKELVEWVASKPWKTHDGMGEKYLHIDSIKEILSRPDLYLLDKTRRDNTWTLIPLAEALEEKGGTNA